MAKRVKVPISTARIQLFQLADLVRKSDDAVVVLEQRGGAEPVALVREARLAYLEERVTQLDERQDASFTLAGSLATELEGATLKQALHQIRQEWSRAPLHGASGAAGHGAPRTRSERSTDATRKGTARRERSSRRVEARRRDR